MNNTVGFALIGCGAIARWHAAALARLPGAALVGVYDVQPAAAAAFAAAQGVRAYACMEQLLADDAVQAVCICTPSGCHAADALAAIRAGKHTLIEKPLALTVADCDTLIAAAAAAGVQAGVVSQLRFAAAAAALHGLLAAGGLGRVLSAQLTMQYHRTPEYYAASPWRGTWAHDGGGALMNQGIHGIDLLLQLMGNVRTVHGLARTLVHDIEVEDTAAALLEFENGAVATVLATTAATPGSPRTLTITGTAGTVTLTEDTLTRWDVPGAPLPAGLALGGAASSGAAAPGDIDVAGHAAQLADFAVAVREQRPPSVTLADGRRAVELITAIYTASRTAGPVTL